MMIMMIRRVPKRCVKARSKARTLPILMKQLLPKNIAVAGWFKT